jgi:hypothetical protein
MARTEITDRGIFRVAANISSKQSPTADKGLSSSFELGGVLTAFRRKESACYETLQRTSDLDVFSGKRL